MGVLGGGVSIKARGAVRRGTAELRKGVVLGGAAWAGLNVVAPDSNLTKGANVVAAAGMAYGGGLAAGRRFGRGARNLTWGAAGAFGAAKMFGAF